jgi:hypothetical protein
MDAKPFDQGVAAATDGLPASENPYAEGTSANASWNEGYHSVIDQREDIEGTDDPAGRRGDKA